MSTGLRTLAAGRQDLRRTCSGVAAESSPSPGRWPPEHRRRSRPARRRWSGPPSRRPRGSGHQASARAQSNISSVLSRPDDPGLAEGGVKGRIPPRQRAGVRGHRLPPALRTPDLDRHHRLGARHPPGLLDELWPSPTPFQVHGHHPRVRVGGRRSAEDPLRSGPSGCPGSPGATGRTPGRAPSR